MSRDGKRYGEQAITIGQGAGWEAFVDTYGVLVQGVMQELAEGGREPRGGDHIRVWEDSGEVVYAEYID